MWKVLVSSLEKSQSTFQTELHLTCLGQEASLSHSFSSANRNCEKESPGNRKNIQFYVKAKRKTLSSLNFPLGVKVLFLKSWPTQTQWYHSTEGPGFCIFPHHLCRVGTWKYYWQLYSLLHSTLNKPPSYMLLERQLNSPGLQTWPSPHI